MNWTSISKITCQRCGRRISANNRKRHKRACKGDVAPAGEAVRFTVETKHAEARADLSDAERNTILLGKTP